MSVYTVCHFGSFIFSTVDKFMAVRYFWKIRKMLCIDICFDPVNRLDEYHDTLIYYIPINVISLGTVDFTECDPMLQITTLWFSESISPLSETDDVVHNVFSIHNA